MKILPWRLHDGEFCIGFRFQGLLHGAGFVRGCVVLRVWASGSGVQTSETMLYKRRVGGGGSRFRISGFGFRVPIVKNQMGKKMGMKSVLNFMGGLDN